MISKVQQQVSPQTLQYMKLITAKLKNKNQNIEKEKVLEFATNAVLEDGTRFVMGGKNSLIKHPEITLNNKTRLIVDELTGQILEHTKPFFTPWKKVLKQAEQALAKIHNNFENSKIVTVPKLRIHYFMKGTVDRLQKINRQLARESNAKQYTVENPAIKQSEMSDIDFDWIDKLNNGQWLFKKK